MNFLKVTIVLLSTLFVLACGIDGPPIAPSEQVE